MNEDKHIEFLTNKSIESFLMCIEVFNKPTISYRLEGCVFFLCNAWELMLKAKLLKDGKSIYYPNNNRTLSLHEAAARIMTNSNDPIRENLNVIISIRNIATHDVIPEFEIIYMPFLTFCVKAYSEKLYEYLGINIHNYIKTDFLSLFVNNSHIDKTKILSKYGENMFNIFNEKLFKVNELYNSDNSIAYNVEFALRRVSKKEDADFNFYSSNNSKDQNIKYVDRMIDFNNTHTYTHHKIADEINEIIKRDNIPFTPIGKLDKFSYACLDILLKKYKFKDNEKYCLKIENGNNTVCKYSQQLITKIISMITDDKDIVSKSR